MVGGFGSAVLDAAAAAGGGRVTRLGLPDRWIMQGARADQLAEAGLDVGSIEQAIRDAGAGRSAAVRVARTDGVNVRSGR